MSRFSTKPSANGFSLLELLVAITVLVLIMGMLFNIFSKSSDAWLSGQRSINRSSSARLALDWMTRDLSQSFFTTSSPPINFFGFSNAVYFIAPGHYEQGNQSAGDLAEIAYVFDRNTGNLYRYLTPPNKWNPAPATENLYWNPRDDPDYPHSGATVPSGVSTAWRWPALTNSFLYTTPVDTLVAEGVVDMEINYILTNDATVYTSWCTTNIGGGVHFASVLPSVVDIYITALPANMWKAPNTPSAAAYANLTNRHSRVFQTSVNLEQGPPR